METLKGYLIPKPFSKYGYIVAVANLVAGFIVGVITSIRRTERRNFNCITDKDFLTTRCFNQYEQDYNSSLPLYGFTWLTFGSLVVVCIIYGWCLAKSRVEEIERRCTPTADNPRPIPIKTRRIFWYYLSQLLFQFCLGTIFVFLQLTGLQALNFPSEFQCRTNSKETSIAIVDLNGTYSNSSVNILNCENSFAREKTFWAKLVLTFHIIVAILVLLEALCIIARACRNKNFTRDSDFCQRYLVSNTTISLSQMDFGMEMELLLKNTEYLEPLIPRTLSEADSRRAIDDVYVDVIIHPGRVTHEFDMSKDRHELLDVYFKTPETLVRIQNISDIFISDGKSCKNILIVGRPGIGKTSLCTKIIRDWCKGEIKQFKCVFLFKFRHLSADRFKKMSLLKFLKESEHSSMNIDSSMLQSIYHNPESLLFVFDGLDEYKNLQDLYKDETDFSGLNSGTDEMPATALYAKLLKGKMLSGATRLTTSRPHAVNSLNKLYVCFERFAEILGFTPEKAYVADKFCKDDVTAASMIWQHIKSNINLLYLCYIPVTCWIVCSFLEDFIKKQNDVNSFILPTTLTDIYKGALRIFLFKHNPEYRQQQTASSDSHGFSEEIEEVLSKLGSLARKGIEEKRLVFEKEEVQQLENCGLINCMPSKENPAEFGLQQESQYCFIHLTLQEFLAAREITKRHDPDEVCKFISSKIDDGTWHLVIQFIAGLLQGHSLQISSCFENLLFESLKNGCSNVTLLMFKCFYELSNKQATAIAAAKLVSIDRLGNRMDCRDSNVTPPDCTAIVYVLRYCGAGLKSLDISLNNSFGDQGCAELMKIFDGESKNVDDYESGKCHLIELDLGGNQITDQGASCLSDALKSDNCHLTELYLGGNKIADQGVSYLSDALQRDNCHLSWLDLGFNQITDQGISYLSDALRSGICLVSELCLGGNQITDQGALHLSDALKSLNCPLTELYLESNQITDRGASCLTDTACKLSSNHYIMSCHT